VSTDARASFPRRHHSTASSGPSTCSLSWRRTLVWWRGRARLALSCEWKTSTITRHSFNDARTSRRFPTASPQVLVASLLLPSPRHSLKGFCFQRRLFVCSPHASKVPFLALSVTFLFFFVCESNISGTAERICAKFTGKACLVPRLEEFECQGQRSKFRSLGTKTLCALQSPPVATEWNVLAAITSFSSRRDHGLRVVCVW